MGAQHLVLAALILNLALNQASFCLSDSRAPLWSIGRMTWSVEDEEATGCVHSRRSTGRIVIKDSPSLDARAGTAANGTTTRSRTPEAWPSNCCVEASVALIPLPRPPTANSEVDRGYGLDERIPLAQGRDGGVQLVHGNAVAVRAHA